MLLRMEMSALTVVVIVANALGGAMAVPQAAKMLRTGVIDGISPTWAGISTVVNAWWGVYAIGIGDWGIFPVAVISVMAYSVITLGVVRRSSSPSRTMKTVTGTSAAIAVAPLVGLWAGGWLAAGLVLGTLYGIQLSPAVVAVYRTHDVGGVSAATWVLALAEAVLWGVYGAARLDAGLLALAATGSFMSALVLARLVIRRPRRPRRQGEYVGLAPA